VDALTYFKQEQERHVTAAQEIVDQADEESRALNEGERAMVKEHTLAAQDFALKIKDAEDNDALRGQIEKLGHQLATEPESVPASLAHTPGDAFVNSDGYKALLQAGITGSWRTPAIEFLGAAGDPVMEKTGNNAGVVFEQQLAGLKTPSLRQETPSLAGLFAQGVATSNTIKYIIVTTRNAPANAVTIEDQQKPGAEFAFDDATETLEKLAAFIPISEEMIEDSPAVRDYINAQLPFMVRQAEDKKLATEIYGAATGVGDSTDIGGTDGNGFDAIAAGINDVQVNAKVDPDGLFIHPTDWWTLAVKKDSVAGQYYSGGPYAGPARNPWGVAVVISQRAPLGFPLVGNFAQGGQVWRRGGIRLEASNSHDDYFRRNLVAIRAEERLALTIYYPEMFSVCNLAS
jgi:HK97 family phage major capsid protein